MLHALHKFSVSDDEPARLETDARAGLVLLLAPLRGAVRILAIRTDTVSLPVGTEFTLFLPAGICHHYLRRSQKVSANR